MTEDERRYGFQRELIALYKKYGVTQQITEGGNGIYIPPTIAICMVPNWQPPTKDAQPPADEPPAAHANGTNRHARRRADKLAKDDPAP